MASSSEIGYGSKQILALLGPPPSLIGSKSKTITGPNEAASSMIGFASKTVQAVDTSGDLRVRVRRGTRWVAGVVRVFNGTRFE